MGTKGTLTVAEETRRIRAGLLLRGDTYDHRLTISLAGGVWDPALRAWLVKDEEICRSLGATFREDRRGTGWWLKDFTKRTHSRRTKPPGSR